MQELKEYLMFRDFIFPMMMLAIFTVVYGIGYLVYFIHDLIKGRKKK